MLTLTALIIALTAATPVFALDLPAGLAGIWAQEGGDKVLRDDRRTLTQGPRITNRVWNGERIHLFGGRNEVLNFALVLDASDTGATKVSVRLGAMTAANGDRIENRPRDPNDVFNWVGRPIELFFVRYLRILGLSKVSYAPDLDELQIPEQMRRPLDANGKGTGQWKDRPGANREFPDIAVPMELVPTFDIAGGNSQMVWGDIYISTEKKPGLYTGELLVSTETTENGNSNRHSSAILIEVDVRPYALPDVPKAKTMLNISYDNINHRYLRQNAPQPRTPEDEASIAVRDKHFQLAHRHKISLIDGNGGGEAWEYDRGRHDWIPRLNGQLFQSNRGYDGPGVGVGNGVFSIGTYGSWAWKQDGEKAMHEHLNAWERWFQTFDTIFVGSKNPPIDRFLYLADESQDHEEMQEWASWIRSNPGEGRNIKSFATIQLPTAHSEVPALDISASLATPMDKGPAAEAYAKIREDNRKQVFFYNGRRPVSGSFATDDDGVALRELAWAQAKLGIDRWFYWEGTYYFDRESARGDNNVWEIAQTIGEYSKLDPVIGKTGYNYSNGDGVLFYPGTDNVFEANSYGVAGPIASLRLKYWRRGIQDADYIEMARQYDAEAVNRIITRVLPKALWEYGTDKPGDHEVTWVSGGISWPTDPDQWEAAREELAAIIEAGLKNR